MSDHRPRRASAAAGSRSGPSPSSRRKPPSGAGAGSGSGAGSGTRRSNPRRLGRFVSSKVAARNSALNVAGGVKVDVFVRCRPLNDRELAAGGTSVVEANPEKKVIKIVAPDDKKAPVDPMEFDNVFGPEATQEQVYTVAVQPVVDQVVRSLSCCLFAYGQTGTGKTHTMMGDLKDPEQHGIVLRAVSETIERLKTAYEDVRLRITYMELYNEQLEDLLAPSPAPPGTKPLRLVDDTHRGTVCHGLTEVEVETTEEVASQLIKAEKRARVSETKMNKQSNRAHRIFTLLATFRRASGMVNSALTLVDLAGSESVGRSGAEGAMAKEAGNINKSLLTLGRVINALASNTPHIPYRDSKLTRLTSEALGGVCKTSFIATITPSVTDLGETLSTLRYAKNAMEALNISQLPRWKQDEIMIEHLTRRVAQLEQNVKDEADRHKVDETMLQQRIGALEAEKTELAALQARTEAQVRELQEERTALKATLHSVAAHRDRVISQKRALRSELADTQAARDNLHADRTQLQGVLATVRRMRNRLLEAHQQTERTLSSDAQTLQAAMEAAVADIDGLHAEIARKKGMSLANEVTADEFRDHMSGRLHAIMDSVTDFRAEQVSGFEGLRESMNAMLLKRQQEVAGLTAELTRMTTVLAQAHDELSTSVAEADVADKNRSRELRDKQRDLRDSTVERVARVRDTLESSLGDLRAQTTGLEEQFGIWADKVSSHLSDSDRSVTDFVSSVTSDLKGLDEFAETAVTAHLALVDKHRQALADHLSSERQAVMSSAARLQDDIQAQVERLVAEHAKTSIRRIEAAVTTFTTQTDTMSTDVQSIHNRLQTRSSTLADKATAWGDSHASHIKTGEATNRASLEASVKTTKLTATTISAAQSQLRDGVTALNTLASDHLTDVKDSLAAAGQARATATKALRSAVEAATEQHRSASTALSTKQDAAHEEFKKGVEDVDGSLSRTADAACDWTEDHNEQLGEAQADVLKYVDEDIQRDVKSDVPKTAYTFPTDFPHTRAYRDILSSHTDDWAREEDISTGALVPGQGVDFGSGAPGSVARPAIPTSTAASSVAESDDEDVLDVNTILASPSAATAAAAAAAAGTFAEEDGDGGGGGDGDSDGGDGGDASDGGAGVSLDDVAVTTTSNGEKAESDSPTASNGGEETSNTSTDVEEAKAKSE